MHSIYRKSEMEVVAQNIMIILSRTGNEFRVLSWDEYKTERLKDGGFLKSIKAEQSHFNKVFAMCSTEVSARKFSPTWADV
ncbi:MAG: hypothetical protein GY804_11615 [Alphaproteobacteria bacterium]|nr:hypothetical protein [Alphaproteobacteria bacterium]